MGYDFKKINEQFLDDFNSFLGNYNLHLSSKNLLHGISDIYMDLPFVNALSFYLLTPSLLTFQNYLTQPEALEEFSSNILESSFNEGILTNCVNNSEVIDVEVQLLGVKQYALFIPLVSTEGAIGILTLFSDQSISEIDSLFLKLLNMNSFLIASLISGQRNNNEYNVSSDIIEQKISMRTISVEQSKRELKLVIESMPVAVFVLDANNYDIIDVNVFAEKMSGMSKNEILNTSRDFYFVEKDGEQYTSAKCNFSSEPKECYFKNDRDLLVPILFMSSYLQLSARDIIIESFIDISLQKELLNELIKAKNIVEEQSEYKSNLIRNISHEIRTPLDTIMGFAEFLSTELDNSSEYGDVVKSIYDAGNKLSQLLTSIVDFSVISNGSYLVEPKEINVNKYFEIKNSEYKKLCSTKELFYTYEIADENIKIFCDEWLFDKVLNNIILNAINFTYIGEIFVKVDTYEELTFGKQYLQITVLDTGIGIDKEKLGNVFDAVYLSNNDSKYDAKKVGLGLPTIKKIISLINGNINISSEIGKGTKVILHIPMKYTTI